MLSNVRAIFPSVKYAFTTIPSYPSGQIGFIIASKDATVDASVPAREIPTTNDFQYYSPEVHRAAFVLPAFAAKRLA